MRRKLYYLTAGLAATLLLAAACSSDDTAEKPVPEPATLTAPALTLSADAVLVDPERSTSRPCMPSGPPRPTTSRPRSPTRSTST